MKILIINYEYPPLGGGGAVATRDVAQQLAQRHEVSVLTTRFEGLANQERVGGVHVHRVGVLGRVDRATATLRSMVTFVPMALWRGWRLMRREQFDVVNAQFVIPSGIPAALLARWFGVPLVVSFIGGDVYDPSKALSPHRSALLRWLVRWIGNQAHACTAISEDTKQRAQDLHGVTSPITVTHLGLLPRSQPARQRAMLDVPDASQAYVSVGRLIARKGYDQLIRAWADLPSDMHLIIVGDGPQRDELERLSEQLGVAERVHLRGFVSEEEKHTLLVSADGYVSAALHEGFGIVFLEAMAAGLPIVAFDEGGHTDFLVHEHNALLVSGDGDAQGGLRDALMRLHDDASLRRALGTHNQFDVHNFTLDRTARAFEAVIMRAYEGSH